MVFVRSEVRHINIAHGLYPREDLSEEILAAMTAYLAGAVDTRSSAAFPSPHLAETNTSNASAFEGVHRTASTAS